MPFPTIPYSGKRGRDIPFTTHAPDEPDRKRRMLLQTPPMHVRQTQSQTPRPAREKRQSPSTQQLFPLNHRLIQTVRNAHDAAGNQLMLPWVRGDEQNNVVDGDADTSQEAIQNAQVQNLAESILAEDSRSVQSDEAEGIIEPPPEVKNLATSPGRSSNSSYHDVNGVSYTIIRDKTYIDNLLRAQKQCPAFVTRMFKHMANLDTVLYIHFEGRDGLFYSFEGLHDSLASFWLNKIIKITHPYDPIRIRVRGTDGAFYPFISQLRRDVNMQIEFPGMHNTGMEGDIANASETPVTPVEEHMNEEELTENAQEDVLNRGYEAHESFTEEVMESPTADWFSHWFPQAQTKDLSTLEAPKLAHTPQRSKFNDSGYWSTMPTPKETFSLQQVVGSHFHNEQQPTSGGPSAPQWNNLPAPSDSVPNDAMQTNTPNSPDAVPLTEEEKLRDAVQASLTQPETETQDTIVSMTVSSSGEETSKKSSSELPEDAFDQQIYTGVASSSQQVVEGPVASEVNSDNEVPKDDSITEDSTQCFGVTEQVNESVTELIDYSDDKEPVHDSSMSRSSSEHKFHHEVKGQSEATPPDTSALDAGSRAIGHRSLSQARRATLDVAVNSPVKSAAAGPRSTEEALKFFEKALAKNYRPLVKIGMLRRLMTGCLPLPHLDETEHCTNLEDEGKMSAVQAMLQRLLPIVEQFMSNYSGSKEAIAKVVGLEELDSARFFAGMHLGSHNRDLILQIQLLLDDLIRAAKGQPKANRELKIEPLLEDLQRKELPPEENRRCLAAECEPNPHIVAQVLSHAVEVFDVVASQTRTDADDPQRSEGSESGDDANVTEVEEEEDIVIRDDSQNQPAVPGFRIPYILPDNVAKILARAFSPKDAVADVHYSSLREVALKPLRNLAKQENDHEVVDVPKLLHALRELVHEISVAAGPTEKAILKIIAEKIATVLKRGILKILNNKERKRDRETEKMKNWRQAQKAIVEFEKDVLGKAIQVKVKGMRPCSYVNKPRKCSAGQYCWFSHELEGKMCPQKMEGFECEHRGTCWYSHDARKLSPCPHMQRERVCDEDDDCPYDHSRWKEAEPEGRKRPRNRFDLIKAASLREHYGFEEEPELSEPTIEQCAGATSDNQLVRTETDVLPKQVATSKSNKRSHDEAKGGDANSTEPPAPKRTRSTSKIQLPPFQLPADIISVNGELRKVPSGPRASAVQQMPLLGAPLPGRQTSTGFWTARQPHGLQTSFLPLGASPQFFPTPAMTGIRAMNWPSAPCTPMLQQYANNGNMIPAQQTQYPPGFSTVGAWNPIVNNGNHTLQPGQGQKRDRGTFEQDQFLTQGDHDQPGSNAKKPRHTNSGSGNMSRPGNAHGNKRGRGSGGRGRGQGQPRARGYYNN